MDKYKALYRFKDELMDEFIACCDGNDFNELSLLEISDIVDAVYNRCVEEIE